MFLLGFFLLAVVTVPLAGGKLMRLADLELRRTWLIVLAIGLQIVIISVIPGGDSWVHDAIHLATYVIAFAWLFVNRHVPGLLIAGTGGGLNFLAIAANGGVMPADAGALRTAGIEHTGAEFENSTVVPDAKLQFLGDVFAIPDGWPLANVFSVGDVLLAFGIFVGLHQICRSRLGRALARSARSYALSGFEAIRPGGSQALLRVAAVVPAGDHLAALHVEAGERRRRIAPLPGSDGATAGFAIQAGLLDRGARFAIELASGAKHALPDPSTRPLEDRTSVR